jgi:hypothetical protein
MKPMLALVLVAMLCGACSPPPAPPEKVDQASNAAPSAMPPMGQAANDPETVKKAEADLASLKSNYETAKAVFEQSKDNKTAKEAYLVAAVKYGHESMMSPALTPRVKYPQALRIYREVLKVDPNNEVAKSESDLIIKIYGSMNKPVPQE